MEVNTAGLFGMLGNAHEWYSDNNELYAVTHRPNEIKNKLCYWEEYYYNYDAIAFQLSKKICSDMDRFGFRIVLNARTSPNLVL
jgi:hypothetical protein